MIATVSNAGRRRSWGFSLAELLVVVGIMSLLVAITLPPLQLARRKAMEAMCSAQLQQLGRALESARSETGFYPLWDDGGTSTRYTWIDVLIQRRLFGSSDGTGQTDRTRPRNVAQIGYCPADRLPDPLNAARHNNLIYPLTRSRGGVDYSYGIGVPLSAGGWAWRAGQAAEGLRPRRFRDHDHHTTGRVLAGDAYAPAIYNLSGQALSSGIWNDPTQFDNTVAWTRHPTSSAGAHCSANLLFQDGHVSTASYARSQRDPVNTGQAFVWYPGEPLHVGPADHYEGIWYPNQPPPGYETNTLGNVFPAEMTPRWYTQTRRWTLITHK